MNFFDWLKQNNCHITFTESQSNYWHVELHGPVKFLNKKQNIYYNPRSWGFDKINSIKSLICLINIFDLHFTLEQQKTVIFFSRTVIMGERIYLPSKLYFPDLKEETNKLAKLKWESAGCPAGMDEKFWLEAENEIISNLVVG